MKSDFLSGCLKKPGADAAKCACWGKVIFRDLSYVELVAAGFGVQQGKPLTQAVDKVLHSPEATACFVKR